MRRYLAAGTLWAGAVAAPQSPTADLVITHASVLDVVTGRVLPDRTVVITRGIITAVTSAAEPVPPSLQRLEARGRLLTPGFIDAHLHLCNLYPPPCTAPRSAAAPL